MPAAAWDETNKTPLTTEKSEEEIDISSDHDNDKDDNDVGHLLQNLEGCSDVTNEDVAPWITCDYDLEHQILIEINVMKACSSSRQLW